MRISNTNYKFDLNKNNKIVHISDIHYCNDYKLERLEIVFDNIKKIDPNFICITGDLIDSTDIDNDKIDIFINWLNKLSNICKIIIILGNHDVEHIKNKKREYYINEYFISKLKSLNNTYFLRNEMYEDENIRFLGLEINYSYYKDSNIEIINEINNLINIPNDKVNILLVHDPDVIFKNKINLEKIDFILCGHTHGGLMPEFIPGHRGLISPKKILFKKNMRGIYDINNTKLIISSGIVKLSKRSHLTKLNDIYSSNIVIITF